MVSPIWQMFVETVQNLCIKRVVHVRNQDTDRLSSTACEASGIEIRPVPKVLRSIKNTFPALLRDPGRVPYGKADKGSGQPGTLSNIIKRDAQKGLFSRR